MIDSISRSVYLINSVVSWRVLAGRAVKTKDLFLFQAVAVGFVPFTVSAKHYNVWYKVATKIREYDMLGEICFAAVTSEILAVELGVAVVPNARLMLWNGTKVIQNSTVPANLYVRFL